MKKCVWCKQTESEVKFDKQAHTIPKSLGGKNICINVCDLCNEYFGNHDNRLPPIETVIKETFNITRTRFLMNGQNIGKNKSLTKFSSIYFKVNLNQNKPSLSIKQQYGYDREFQKKIGRQIKRGIYKMFLEETERQKKNGHDIKFDFIRDFARYNESDYPVFYFERKYGIIAISMDWVKSPTLFLSGDYKMKYLIKHSNFEEFEFLGHVFSIPTSKDWNLYWDDYLIQTSLAKKNHFKSIKLINHFNDIDLALSILND